MAVSTAANLSRAIRRTARNCKTFQRRVVEEGTKAIQKSADRRLKADTGGDASLSNAPGKLRVTRTVKGDSIVEGVVEPSKARRGQWAWLEEGTLPHRIGRWMHPGARAKGTWSEGTRPGLEAAQQIISREYERAVEF